MLNKVKVDIKNFLYNFNEKELIDLKELFIKYNKYENSELSNNLLKTYNDVLNNITLVRFIDDPLDEMDLNDDDYFPLTHYSDLLFLYHMYDVVVKHEVNPLFIDKMTYICCLMYAKEEHLRHNAKPISKYSLEEYTILLEKINDNELRWYAKQCGVKPILLTPEILYNHYLQDNQKKLKRSK